MKCFEDGVLRARLDGELSAAENESVQEHLDSCERCRSRSEAIAREARRVEYLLQMPPGTPAIDPASAYLRHREKFVAQIEDLRPFSGFRARGWWGGLAAASLLVLLFSFAPARTWGQRILEMLRVQKVAVVPVAINPVGVGGQQQMIARFFSDNVVVTMDPGKPVSAPNADAASQMAGFRVETFAEITPTQVRVANQTAFHMTLDRDRIEAVLNQVGRPDIQVPKSVDGSTVAVYIPKSVQLEYGNCAKKTAGDDSCMLFLQVPAPTVSVPPNLNISALAEAGLQIAGMSAAEAHSFAQTVDWSSTLVIPVPQNGGSYRPVTVDGVKGTLVEMAPHGNVRGAYSLVWLKNGIIYSIHGRGSSSEALAAASSLG